MKLFPQLAIATSLVLGLATLRACQETTFTIYYLESLLRRHF
ncbi:MAG: hypothetical protein V7K69_28485 [Nostoc sp.]